MRRTNVSRRRVLVASVAVPLGGIFGGQSRARQGADAVVGEVVGDDRLAMVVRDVRTTRSLGEFANAESGNVFVVVRLVVKNRGDRHIPFSSLLQTRVKDAANHVYEQSMESADVPFRGGELVPGEVERGDLVFEVPESASGLRLQFDLSAFDVFSLERVVVDLASRADQVADLEQDLRVETHPVGSSVERREVTATVHGVRTATELGEFTSAADGNEYVVPDVTVENGTGSALTPALSVSSAVKDGRGRSYGQDAGASTALDQPFAQGSEIASGSARRGELVYQVPEGASALHWAYDFGALDVGYRTFWRLR